MREELKKKKWAKREEMVAPSTDCDPSWRPPLAPSFAFVRCKMSTRKTDDKDTYEYTHAYTPHQSKHTREITRIRT
jgi:hypothetical protein